MAGLESGADEFLIRPLKPSLVRVRVRTMLRNKALIDSLEEAETILFALAKTKDECSQLDGGETSPRETRLHAPGNQLHRRRYIERRNNSIFFSTSTSGGLLSSLALNMDSTSSSVKTMIIF